MTNEKIETLRDKLNNLIATNANYDEIYEVLKDYDVPVIVDSAESLGGSYKGKKCGSFGDISIISFSYSKLVTTSMGGAVLSENEEYIKNVSYTANQSKAKSPCYIHKYKVQKKKMLRSIT